jgi:TRAP-type C4-dicarboxylate transport system permease small subunit
MLLKAAKLVETVLFYIMAALLGIITSLIIVLVILRYFFGTGIFGGNDFSKMLFVYTTALGAAALTSSKGHIAISFFVNILPPGVRQVIEAIKHLLMGGMFLLIVYYSTIWIWKTGMFKIESLDTPQWISQISMVIGGIFGFLYCLLNLFLTFRQKQIQAEAE